MLILSIDTTDAFCRVGLHDFAAPSKPRLATYSRAMPSRQAEALLPMVHRLLSQCGYHKRDPSAIAVATGPGSFSGIRIGLATARGLGLALSKPVIGCDNFTLWRKTIKNSGTAGENHALLLVLNSKRADLYTAAFANAHKTGFLLKPQSRTRQTLQDCLGACKKPLYLGGNMNDILMPQLTAAVTQNIIPLSLHNFALADLAETAMTQLKNNTEQNKNAEPFYLRQPQTSKSKKLWHSR